VSDFAAVSHSVLGELVRVGARARLLADPPDGETVHVDLGEKTIDTRLQRLGLVAGDRSVVPPGCQVPAGRLLDAGGSWTSNEPSPGAHPPGERLREAD
jgi:hypothetical protein